ncbi:Retinol dehydrogenase 12 [Tulasnella sp. 403]|nr:Retinol dehydrogenase 12 [Tulasnella sp. 403]
MYLFDVLKERIASFQGNFYSIFAPFLPSLRIPSVDLHGKRALVTGANSGIGKAIAESLAAQGAEVWLICRSKERGEPAAEDIRRSTGNEKVFVEVVELKSLQSAREFAERWAKRGKDERRIDILVNNAGVSMSQKCITVDGFEATYEINFLSSFLFTTLLLKASCFSPDARIVQVSSYAIYAGGRPDPTKLSSPDILGSLKEGEVFEFETLMKIYGRSKGLQTLWTRELQEKLDNTEAWEGIVVSSCHPGVVMSAIWDRPEGMKAYEQTLTAFKRFCGWVAVPASQGAVTPVFLATSPKVVQSHLRGQYWDRLGVKWLPAWMSDRRLCDALWRKWEEDAGVEASF